jgi:hypothetical protein
MRCPLVPLASSPNGIWPQVVNTSDVYAALTNGIERVPVAGGSVGSVGATTSVDGNQQYSYPMALDSTALYWTNGVALYRQSIQ